MEERLAKKSDDLIAAESEISPLKQEVITLRSERDYIKIENETLQTSIDQWRKRATTIMTKVVLYGRRHDYHSNRAFSLNASIRKFTSNSKQRRNN